MDFIKILQSSDLLIPDLIPRPQRYALLLIPSYRLIFILLLLGTNKSLKVLNTVLPANALLINIKN